MAAIQDIWGDIGFYLKTFINSAGITDINVFIDTQGINSIQDLTRDHFPMIGVFDGKMSRDTTRWTPIVLTPEIREAELVSTLSSDSLNTLSTQTLTLSGNIVPGDAVSFIVQAGQNTKSVAEDVIEGDTLTAIATRLAARINNAVPLQSLATAVAVGAVVTLTAVSGLTMNIFSLTGSTGFQITEWARRESVVKVTLACKTYDQRFQIGQLILAAIAKKSASFGLKQYDGTWCRIKPAGDTIDQNTHNSDIWTWHFFITAEYGITTQDILYAAIAPNIIKVLKY